MEPDRQKSGAAALPSGTVAAGMLELDEEAAAAPVRTTGVRHRNGRPSSVRLVPSSLRRARLRRTSAGSDRGFRL
jgi:hypothetical protein